MRTSDDDVKQALGQVAKLGGFNIKRMATTDDLKDHTITITITRTSEGWHQERLAFEDQTDMVASVNRRGEVESLNGAGPIDPTDLTETDETLALATDPDEGEQPTEAPIETAVVAEAEGGIADMVDGEPVKPHLVRRSPCRAAGGVER